MGPLTSNKYQKKKKPQKNIHKNIYPTHTHSYTTTKKEKNFVASNVLVPSLMLTKAKKEKYHEREGAPVKQSTTNNKGRGR